VTEERRSARRPPRHAGRVSVRSWPDSAAGEPTSPRIEHPRHVRELTVLERMGQRDPSSAWTGWKGVLPLQHPIIVQCHRVVAFRQRRDDDGSWRDNPSSDIEYRHENPRSPGTWMQHHHSTGDRSITIDRV
jgi:hypothetical protein